MATTEQTILCRRDTNLKSTGFKSVDPKFVLAGWNTTREGANAGVVMYTDQGKVRLLNSGEKLVLYAVWKERTTKIGYEKLSISATNVAYNVSTTTISYSVVLTKTYTGDSVPYLKTVLTGTATSSSFGTNGDATSENSTNARNVKITWTHPESNLTASTTIIQYGFTPIFKIYVARPRFGSIACYQGNTKLVSVGVVNGADVYSSTSKVFTLKAQPNVLNYQVWVANKKCTYYNKPAKQYLHEGKSKCGQYVTQKTAYLLNHWTGGSINNNTNAQVNVNGTVNNFITYSAYFIFAPLIQNVVIGKWRQSWEETTKTTTEKITYKTVQEWVPTCKTGLKYLLKYGKPTHIGKKGHGYYKTVTYPLKTSVTTTKKTNVNNIRASATHYDAPYIFVVPSAGTLTITGAYGIKTYGCTCKREGGFKLLRFNKKSNSYDNYKTFQSVLDNRDQEFSFSLKVSADDRIMFAEPFSLTPSKTHIAIWINKILLDPNI